MKSPAACSAKGAAHSRLRWRNKNGGFGRRIRPWTATSSVLAPSSDALCSGPSSFLFLCLDYLSLLVRRLFDLDGPDPPRRQTPKDILVEEIAHNYK